jgi:hypothetical protein
MGHADTDCEHPNRNACNCDSAHPRRIQTVSIPKYLRTTYMTLTLALRYWMSLNENGHLIETATSSSTASTQRMHETMLLLDRIVWQGTAFKDWVIHVRNNHPMMSMLFADRIHPYSRHEKPPSPPLCFMTTRVFRFERFCVWVACFGYSFLMATYTVELTSPSKCDEFTGVSVSELRAKFDCQLGYPAYFGFTFGAISMGSFLLNVALEYMSTCKCAIISSNEVLVLGNLLL